MGRWGHLEAELKAPEPNASVSRSIPWDLTKRHYDALQPAIGSLCSHRRCQIQPALQSSTVIEVGTVSTSSIHESNPKTTTASQISKHLKLSKPLVDSEVIIF